MEIQTKALYNLLCSNWKQNPRIAVKPWQVEDYRSIPMEDLWQRLKLLGIDLDEKRFRVYVENCDNPEELVECLWLEDDDLEGQDHAYLTLFELWRRLFPKKQSLSLFCDELDHRIDLYDENVDGAEELVQEALSELEDTLDQNVDHGVTPKDVFATIMTYCAHDLESFLNDFIAEQIDAENDIYASELIDGFIEYVQDEKWFDFLRIRLLFMVDEQKAGMVLRRLLEQLQEEPNLDLLLEIAQFLVHAEDEGLFFQVIKQSIGLIKKEEDFQDLLSIVADYYRCLDKEKEESTIQKILDKRLSLQKSAEIAKGDPDFTFLQSHLEEVISSNFQDL
ncbi:MAG: hypothetical protein HKM07_01220 [Chlamydiae bacterium]|nr:hypothetical protein [Chlamydiota bacterium]